MMGVTSYDEWRRMVRRANGPPPHEQPCSCLLCDVWRESVRLVKNSESVKGLQDVEP